ncbi:MAG TPA: FMN-binding protein [Bacteroidales bacterium]|nr:FMN-binding protein [Bacteroidales bacterium]
MKTGSFFLLSIGFLLISLACQAQSKVSQTKPYNDGVYTGQSRSVYTSEPYWGKVTVSIEGGVIRNVSFQIRDSSLHETFNNDYAAHFKGNDLYIKQTMNDWNGVKTYPKLLFEKQDIKKVDAMSGATWSYNIFKSAFSEAMK